MSDTAKVSELIEAQRNEILSAGERLNRLRLDLLADGEEPVSPIAVALDAALNSIDTAVVYLDGATGLAREEEDE